MLSQTAQVLLGGLNPLRIPSNFFRGQLAKLFCNAYSDGPKCSICHCLVALS